MNPNVWNIKEILSIPTGTSGTKTTGRIGPTSDYSSLTDSQFLFGSQFWPETSQGISQEMSFSSKTSQQSSQEASELKISSSYHTKPFLFGGDCKDKGKVPNFTSGKAIGMLDRFEEDKKKAKEKFESSGILATEFLQFRENLENMKLSVNSIDQSTTICKKVLLEGLDNFVKTFQQNISSLQGGIALQLDAMVDKVSSQSQMLKDIEERTVKMGVATTELSIQMHGLQQNLEALKQEQRREQSMLGEALSLLGTLVSQHGSGPSPVRVTDSTVQTSPGLGERFCLVSEENRFFEGVRLYGATAPLRAVACVGESGNAGLQHTTERGPPETCEETVAPRAFYPLVMEDHCSQMVPDEVTKSSWEGVCHGAVTHRTGMGSATALHYPVQDPSRAYAVLQDVTISTRYMNTHCDPEQSSQPDHTEPTVPSEGPGRRRITAVSKFKQRGQRRQPFRSKKRVLLPLQSTSKNSGRDENRQPLKLKSVQNLSPAASPIKDPYLKRMVTLKPLPLKQQNTEIRSNKSTGGNLNPLWSSLWSQDSKNSLCNTVNERPAWEKMPPPGPKAEVTERTRGFWQLFDINCDSD